jgi:hypothetical protein
VAAGEPFDIRVRDYVKRALGAGVLKYYRIRAHTGEVHILEVRVVVPGDSTLAVIEKLMPYVQNFSCSIMPTAGKHEMMIDADMMININDLERE